MLNHIPDIVYACIKYMINQYLVCEVVYCTILLVRVEYKIVKIIIVRSNLQYTELGTLCVNEKKLLNKGKYKGLSADPRRCYLQLNDISKYFFLSKEE